MRECTSRFAHLVTASALAAGVLGCASAQTGSQTLPASAGGVVAADAPINDYWVYVGSESADVIQRVKFGPNGLLVEKSIPVGESPVETEGPHGLQISRDAGVLHFTTGHGTPRGKYWRLAVGPDTLLGPGLLLGQFPASIDVTADGAYAFVANFNLYGPMSPSSISVVYAPAAAEVARIETCVMPHGGRINTSGTSHYSTCMMDDQLVEIDARQFVVTRRLSLRSDSMHHDMHAPACSPTWAQPSVSDARVFVACNKSDEILEVDVGSWRVTRRFPTGRGPYNLAVTPDGRLVIATLKQGNGIEILDAASGRSVRRLTTSARVTHGVVVTPDSRYAFVSSEGVGSAPGAVDVFDLRTLSRVAAVNVAPQASGIAFWKMEPAKP